jgi:hypothetical protein
MYPPDQRQRMGLDTYEKDAQMRLHPFSPGRDDQYDPDDLRLERNWFKRFWARLRGRGRQS